MVHEGKQITDVRDLTEEDVSILGGFPRGMDTLPGLELESGAVIFPGADEEGNSAGRWPLTREELEELVGKYIGAFSSPEGRNEGPHVSRPPLQLVVTDEKPSIDNGDITISGETINIEPGGGHGIGPAAWFISEPVDEETRPDPEETPTTKEVIEMSLNGEIDKNEYQELLDRAERAHNDTVYHTIA